MRIPSPTGVRKELRESIEQRLLTKPQIAVMVLLYDRQISPEETAAELGMSLKEVLHHEGKALYWMGFKQRRRVTTRWKESTYTGPKHKRQFSGGFHPETVELVTDTIHLSRCTGKRDPAGNCILANRPQTYSQTCGELIETLSGNLLPWILDELTRLRKFSKRYGDLAFERESDTFKLVLPRQKPPKIKRRKRRSTGQFRWED